MHASVLVAALKKSDKVGIATYAQQLRKIMQGKTKKVVVAATKKQPGAKVYDIMSALKASLSEQKKKRA